MSDIELMQGDCIEEMKRLEDESVDAVITDPPYGTTVCKWDNVIPFESMWKQLHRIIKPSGAIVLFGNEPFSSSLRMSNVENYKYDWVWKSNRAPNFAQAPYMPLKNTECIIVFSSATIAANSKNRIVYNPQGMTECDKVCQGKKFNDHRPSRTNQKPYKQTKTGYPSQILKFDKEYKSVHPTQKPVTLMEYLIKTYTNKGETVLDFTMGSGTTGVACVNLNRNFTGIELNEEYFKIAENRLKEVEIYSIMQ